MNKLDIISSTFDTCLLFNRDIIAIIGLQIDNSLIANIIEFMQTKSRELNTVGLVTRPCEGLTTNHPLNFNDFIITLNNNDNMIINQLKQVKKIQLLSRPFTKKQYVTQRARGAYIATISQSQAAFALSYATQITKPTFENAKYLNRCLS